MILSREQVEEYKRFYGAMGGQWPILKIIETALHYMAEAEAANAETAKWRKVAGRFYDIVYDMDICGCDEKYIDSYDFVGAIAAYDEAAKEGDAK